MNLQVLVFEANLTSSLGDLKTAVQEKLGIMAEQQRLIVVGETHTTATSPFVKASVFRNRKPVAQELYCCL